MGQSAAELAGLLRAVCFGPKEQMQVWLVYFSVTQTAFLSTFLSLRFSLSSLQFLEGRLWLTCHDSACLRRFSKIQCRQHFQASQRNVLLQLCLLLRYLFLPEFRSNIACIVYSYRLCNTSSQLLYSPPWALFLLASLVFQPVVVGNDRAVLISVQHDMKSTFFCLKYALSVLWSVARENDSQKISVLDSSNVRLDFSIVLSQ